MLLFGVPYDALRDPTAAAYRRGPRARSWAAAALLGAFLLLAWPTLSYLWWMERAGGLLDRYLVTGERSALLEAGALLGLPAADDGTRPRVPPPAPHSRRDSPHYWRTFGAVAAQDPTDGAFRLLLEARDRGRLDRLGRLWLGEVAAGTGHWDVANQAFSDLDAVNLLVDRGDAAAAAGDARRALHWYLAAAAGLTAEGGPPTDGADDRTGLLDPVPQRAVLLLRVGRGLLDSEADAPALKVLELAESEMRADPPGVRDRQSIRFLLAEALLRDLETHPDDEAAVRSRVESLLERALGEEESGWARFREARLLLRLGERARGVASLRASIALDPGAPEPYLVLGRVLEVDGLLPLARDTYGEALEQIPRHAALSAAWAIASYRTMAPEKALPRLEEAATTPTTDPYLFAALGDCLLDLGDPAGARAAYREGLRRAPGALPLRERAHAFLRPTGPTY